MSSAGWLLLKPWLTYELVLATGQKANTAAGRMRVAMMATPSALMDLRMIVVGTPQRGPSSFPPGVPRWRRTTRDGRPGRAHSDTQRDPATGWLSTSARWPATGGLQGGRNEVVGILPSIRDPVAFGSVGWRRR